MMKRIRRRACGILVCVAATLAASAAVAGANDRPAIMRSIADGWLESQRPDGLLPYGFNFLSGKANDDDKSFGYIAREAGALWVWARYYEQVRDERYREPIRRGIEALVRHSIPFGTSRLQTWLEAAHIYDAPFGRLTLASLLRRFGLLYQPEGPALGLTADGTYDAWTGGTALALLAELAYARASGDDRFATQRARWRYALLALHIPGGGFRSMPTTIDDDDYANGEAWLALAAYADANPGDARVRQALQDIDDAMLTRYSKRPDRLFYHWGAMAAAQRWRTTREPRFVAYLVQQAAVMVQRFERYYDASINDCATMEGFAATRSVLGRDGNGVPQGIRRMNEIFVREMDRLGRLQIAPKQTQLPLGGGAYLYAPALAQFSGAFLWGEFTPETRVDAALHCLSALVTYDENLRSGDPTTSRTPSRRDDEKR